MKILHMISGGDVGGAKTHVLSLLYGLQKENQVLLVCFTEGEMTRDAGKKGIPVEVICDSNLKAVRKRLEDIIRQQKFEIIHCHGSKANMIGVMLKRRVRLPLVTTVHSDPALDYMGRPLGNLIYGNINRYCLKRMDYWVCVAKGLQHQMIQRGAKPDRCFTIANGVDFSKLDPPVAREEYFREIGLNTEPDSVVFGIAARLNPVKDIATLIRAFGQVVEKHPSVRLVIAGDGEQREELEKLSGSLCPNGTVLFAGWISDTDSFYGALDVNMLTSLSEGTPCAVSEGARMHCATIASRVGGVPEMVIQEKTGLLFEPQDTEALTAAMCRMVEQPEFRKAMAEGIFQWVKQHFSLEIMIQTQTAIYETILRDSE